MNYIALFLLSAAGLIAFKKRMLPYAVAMFFFAFLTVGQGLYFDRVLPVGGWIQIIYSYVSWEGYQSAKIYVLLVSILLFLLAVFASKFRRRVPPARYFFEPPTAFYLYFIVGELFIFSFLVFVVVGYGEFLASSRPGYQSGSTIFIVLLFLGVVPLLLKLTCGQKPSRLDLILFGIATAMTSSFSRIHCIFYISAIVYSGYYGLGFHTRNIRFGTAVKACSLAVLALFIFFGVGAARDALNFTSSDIASIISYLRDNPEKSLLSLDYNYTVGVEGMSGLAGAFTQYQNSPSSVSFDGGLHWVFRGALQWLPGFVKEYFSFAYEFLDELNWYTGSVVAPGIESSFTSFGWLGIPIYVFMLYFFIWRRTASLGLSRDSKALLLSYVGLGLAIFLVRGSWTVWVGYSITYFLLLQSTWFIFAKYMKIR